MAERVNVEESPLYNREPGIVVVPGSNYAKEMEKFEQFPSKYGNSPGNAYQYRPYPKMLYRAQLWQGKACCMAVAPDEMEFSQPQELQRAQEAARRFSEKCQLIVKDETERARAFESGWREHPDEAVAYLRQRQLDQGTAAAERIHADRGMSEAAQAEAKEAARQHFDVEGEHLASVPVQRTKRKYTRKIKPSAPAE
jgi:hypothetical protein